MGAVAHACNPSTFRRLRRMDKDACTKELAKAMKKMAKTYFRKVPKGE